MTTEELIAEIERLDAAATAGPWTYKEEGADEFWFGNGYYLIEPFGIPVGASKPESEADAELIASYRTLAVEAARKLRESDAKYKQLEQAVMAESFEILQTLGKAMGYSPLSEFPEIYGPDEVPLDAVMTWEHTPASIAEAAAKKLREAERLLKADEVSRAILGGQE